MQAREKKWQTAVFTAAALATMFLWASAFPIVKHVLDFYSAESIMLLRFLVASLTIGVVSAVRKIRLPQKRDLPVFALGGFFGIFVYMWCFNTGTDYVPSGVSSFLVSASPVYTALLALLILKERISLICWAGILVSFGGQFVIALSERTGFVVNIGVALLIGASVSTSLYAIIQRRILRTYSVFEATAYPMFFGTLYMLIFLPKLIGEMPPAPVEANLFTAYLGVFPAAIAYLLWSYALSKAGNTANATIFIYLIPLISILMAYLWFKETISPLAFAGGIIIIAGMIISGKQQHTR